MAVDITQVQLADFSNLSYPHISGVERGNVGVSIAALMQMEEALEVAPWELVRRIEEEMKGGLMNRRKFKGGHVKTLLPTLRWYRHEERFYSPPREKGFLTQTGGKKKLCDDIMCLIVIALVVPSRAGLNSRRSAPQRLTRMVKPYWRGARLAAPQFEQSR